LALVHFSNEKGVTDFSVTPWHFTWWSWRESNPRPLECHASSPLKLLIFFKNLTSSHRAFVGSCQQSPVGLWRISQQAANGQPTRLWLACQRSCGVTANAPVKLPQITSQLLHIRSD